LNTVEVEHTLPADKADPTVTSHTQQTIKLILTNNGLHRIYNVVKRHTMMEMQILYRLMEYFGTKLSTFIRNVQRH